MAKVKKRVDFYLTSDEAETLDRLVESGIYVSRAEVIRDSLRRYFKYHGIPLSAMLEVPASSEQ